MKLVSFFGTSSSALAESIRKKLLHQLYHQTIISLPTLLLLNLILLYILYGHVPDLLLFGWGVPAVVLNINRIFDTIRFLHTQHADHTLWRRRFAVKSSLSAFLWGFGALILLPYIDNYQLQLIVFVFIMGIAGGAVSSINFDLRIAAAYLFLLLAPVGIYFVIFVDALGPFIGVLFILYFVLLLNVCRNSANAIVAAYIQEEKHRATRNELATRQEELDSLFRQAPIGIFYFDRDMQIIDTNEAFSKLFGLRNGELIGYNLNDLPDQRPLQNLSKVLEGETHYYRGPYHSLKGLDLWIEAKSSPIYSARRQIIGGLTLLENKTKEKEALDELHFLAQHDPLTGLTNRRGLTAHMQEMIRDRRHRNRHSLLFYLDLNHFKQINDSLGHTVGDQLLVEVAKRLVELTEEKDTITRLGGDEFIIVLPFVTETEPEARKTAVSFGEALRKVFEAPFIIEEMHLYIKSSIGIVVIEPGYTDVEEIIRHADISMYQAKRKSKEPLAFYNPELDRERRALFALQHDLNHAVENGELELYYQPIVRIDGDTLRAAEALLRWRHPVQGILAPAQFLPLAIESGLIDEIGWWVTEAVCRQIAEWKSRGGYSLGYTAINLNASQLQTYAFEEKFFSLLHRYGVDPSEIVIELTETSLIENFKQTKDVIDRLQAGGIRCAIDDFGTGYSSLSYLMRLSFSVLKIDRAFIANVADDDEVRFLVESIITIAKRLDYRIVVEGIETEAQRECIASINSEVSYQGFLLSPAVDAGTFAEKFMPAAAG